MRAHQVTPALCLCLLAGCAVGPEFQRPAPPQSVGQAFARSDTASELSPDADPAFWKAFEDPLLSSLVEDALAANYDLRTALAHYDAARATLRQARFDQAPTVTAAARGGRQRLSIDQAFGAPQSTEVYAASLAAGWELDLFGRIRRTIESQSAETSGRGADLQALQVDIVGQLASAYVDLRTAQERLRIARANAERQTQTLRLVSDRVRAGRGSDLDVARAQGLLDTTLARLPALEAQIAVNQHRIAILTGRPPAALVERLDVAAPFPTLPAAIQPGTPASLLRRRPDVLAAEHRLHAATARIGVATADLFPRLSLGAALGTYAFDLDDLLTSSHASNSAVLGVDWAILDVGRVRSRIAATHAEADSLLSAYQATVLAALEDTENALVRSARARQELAKLLAAEAQADKAERLARAQYDAGAIDLFEYLEVQKDQLQAQDARVDGQGRATASAVALYVALAGGWPQVTPKAAGA